MAPSAAHVAWAGMRFRAVDRLTESQPLAAAPPANQRLRVAEAVVIGLKGATDAAKKEKKEKLSDPRISAWPSQSRAGSSSPSS